MSSASVSTTRRWKYSELLVALFKKTKTINKMSFKTIVQHCRALLSRHSFARNGFAFDPSKDQGRLTDSKLDLSKAVVVPDEKILGTYLREHNISDKANTLFLEETFYGCIRFQKLIQSTLHVFYASTGGRYLKNEYSLFAVLIYLALLRLQELKFNRFGRFVKGFDPVKMSRLIGFLFNPVNLDGELKTLWFSILDDEFVKEMILAPMTQNIPAAQVLLAELCDRADHGLITKKSTKAATSVEPFLLTVPRPRKLPEPTVMIPNFTKARPIPESVINGSKEKEILARKKEENKKKSMENYAKAQKKQFAVALHDSSIKLDKVKEEVRRSEEDQFAKSKPVYVRRIPSNTYESVPVKLTTAAILREDALIRKQKEKEEKWLQDVEIGLKDEQEFQAWRDEITLKELEEKRLQLEKRKLEIKLIHEETFIAKQEKLKENKEIVAEAQADKATMRQLADQNKQEVVEENKKKIEKVHEIQEGIHEAKNKLLQDNIRLASEMALEYQAQKEKAAKEAEEDLARKAELIKQIRLLEKSIPAIGSTVKKVDLTETSGAGILGEMSIAELQERLTITKVKLIEAEEERRQEIIDQKCQKMEEISKKMEILDVERLKRKEKRGKTISKPEVVVTADAKLEQLRDTLEAKRRARLAVVASRSNTPLVSQKKRDNPSLPQKETVYDRWADIKLAQKEYETKIATASKKPVRSVTDPALASLAA